jgi:hypothetical protein
MWLERRVITKTGRELVLYPGDYIRRGKIYKLVRVRDSIGPFEYSNVGEVDDRVPVQEHP